ncbi:hypothetical protein DL93DRAFT_2152216 [Clavulina sp. PMI_390]|nr:hypothetical protein DL93DRAFT_2152216 [Clavulina sp. PMI_390]
MRKFHPPRSSTPPRLNRLHASVAPSVAPSATTEASSSTLPLSSLTREHVQVLDAIIARAPKATTIGVILEGPYKDELTSRGIDLEDDVVYYNFLLKVGLVKAPNFAAKWASARKQYYEDRTMNDFTVDDESLAEDDSIIQPTRFSTPRPPQHSAFIQSSRTPNPFISSRRQAQPSRFTPLSSPLRRPRSPVSDSEVSYSVVQPSESDSESDATALMDGEDDDGAATDTDQRSLAPSYETFATSIPHSNFMPIPSKAKARPSFPIHSTPQRGRANSTSALQNPSQPLKPIDPIERAGNRHDIWELRDMEATADQLRQHNLTRIYFAVWRQGSEWISTVMNQAARAQNKDLARCCLLHWVDVRNRIESFQRRVQYVDEIRRLRAAFGHWKRAVVLKAKRDRREGIERRYRQMQSLAEHHFMRTVLKRMVVQWQVLVMRRRQDTSLKRNMLAVWRDRLAHVQALEEELEDYMKEKLEYQARDTLHLWRERASLEASRKWIESRVADRLREAVFGEWARISEMRAIANNHYNKNLQRRALAGWRKRLNHVQVMERRCDVVVLRRDGILRRVFWRLWVTQERAIVFGRVKNTQLVAQLLSRWHERYCTVRHNQERAEENHIVLTQNTTQQMLVVWRERLVKVREMTDRAEDHYERGLLKSAFEQWQGSSKAMVKQMNKGRRAGRWFRKRRFFAAWREAFHIAQCNKKLEQWEQNKRKDIFMQWRERLEVKQHEETMIRRLWKRQDQRMKQRTLLAWAQRVIFLHEREMDALMHYNAKLAEKTFVGWQNAYSRHLDRLALLDSELAIQRETLMRKYLKKLQRRARKKAHRRELEQQAIEAERTFLMRRYLEIFWDRYRERLLESAEDEIVRLGYINTMRAKLHSWMRRTESLPAIHFESLQIKKRALTRWIEALPLAMMMKKALAMEKRNVLAAMFARWKLRYRKQLNAKAIQRARYLRLPGPAETPLPEPTIPRLPRTSRTPISSRQPLSHGLTGPRSTPGVRPSPLASVLARGAAGARASSASPLPRLGAPRVSTLPPVRRPAINPGPASGAAALPLPVRSMKDEDVESVVSSAAPDVQPALFRERRPASANGERSKGIAVARWRQLTAPAPSSAPGSLDGHTERHHQQDQENALESDVETEPEKVSDLRRIMRPASTSERPMPRQSNSFLRELATPMASRPRRSFVPDPK